MCRTREDRPDGGKILLSVAGAAVLSVGGVWAACRAHMDDMLAKLLVDALLAVASYQVQLRWVFE